MAVKWARERAVGEECVGVEGGDGVPCEEEEEDGGEVVNVVREEWAAAAAAAAGDWVWRCEKEDGGGGSEDEIMGVRARSVRCRARWGCCAGREEEEAIVDAGGCWVGSGALVWSGLVLMRGTRTRT